ncbi:iron exporter MbfA [Pseudahrensia aquimaris]|uniref:Iron exporter MbfA n=1 Tax=Pseudahrensia aquimaris TaxID=744461 RepID=A0ABW3FFP8_9HYPH
MFSRILSGSKRSFDSLSEQEILALAISSEEEDARIYQSYADGLREDYPASAAVFDGMVKEENEHRRRLIDLHVQRFGDHVPLIRREHVRGFYTRKADWLVRPLGVDNVRKQAVAMEEQAHRFYLQAAERANDASTRKLLGDLALAESSHMSLAAQMTDAIADSGEIDEEAETEKRAFILTYVQPGLAGLIDGSISTLAPVFAAAFATRDTWETFLIGFAASIGAGISMGFTEALSDDGKLTGRGSPIKRGFASGIMTTVGGLGHALPYLITDFWTATFTAGIVVVFELWAIAWIQNRYMETPFLRSALQIVFGGALVLAAGILIGSA